MQRRRAGVFPGVDNVDARGDERGQYELVTSLAVISVATTTGIPATMMKFITDAGHRQAMNNLSVQHKLFNHWIVLNYCNFISEATKYKCSIH